MISYILQLILIFILSNAEAGYYIEGGIGKNGVIQEDWLGSNNAGAIFGGGFRWHLNKRFEIDLGARHYSHYDRGYPFNNKDESSLNTLNLMLRYEWE